MRWFEYIRVVVLHTQSGQEVFDQGKSFGIDCDRAFHPILMNILNDFYLVTSNSINPKRNL